MPYAGPCHCVCGGCHKGWEGGGSYHYTSTFAPIPIPPPDHPNVPPPPTHTQSCSPYAPPPAPVSLFVPSHAGPPFSSGRVPAAAPFVLIGPPCPSAGGGLRGRAGDGGRPTAPRPLSQVVHNAAEDVNAWVTKSNAENMGRIAELETQLKALVLIKCPECNHVIDQTRTLRMPSKMLRGMRSPVGSISCGLSRQGSSMSPDPQHLVSPQMAAGALSRPQSPNFANGPATPNCGSHTSVITALRAAAQSMEQPQGQLTRESMPPRPLRGGCCGFCVRLQGHCLGRDQERVARPRLFGVTLEASPSGYWMCHPLFNTSFWQPRQSPNEVVDFDPPPPLCAWVPRFGRGVCEGVGRAKVCFALWPLCVNLDPGPEHMYMDPLTHCRGHGSELQVSGRPPYGPCG